MKIIDRLLLTIYTLSIILISIATLGILVAMATNVISLDDISIAFPAFEFGWQFYLVTSLVAVMYLAISIRLLVSGMRPKAPSSTLIKNTDLGAIQVSIEALEIMTQRAVRSFDEIKDVKINVINKEDGVEVRLKVLIMPDVVLQDLTVALQERIKEYIENHSGIVVTRVLVHVDNFTAPQSKPKVQ